MAKQRRKDPFPIRHIRAFGDLSVDSVSLGDRRWLPTSFGLTFDDPKRPVVATLWVTVGKDAVPRVARISVEARDAAKGISSVALRLPLPEILREGAAVVVQIGQEETRGTLKSEVRQWREAFIPMTNPTGPTAQRTRRAYRSVDQERLRRVATVVRRAVEEGKPFIKAVMEVEHVGQSHAKRLIDGARAAGYLEETKPRGRRKGKGR
ncbi:MAG: hypothetical protein WEB06_02060 [Actinomycetota bacterium]